MKVGLDQKEIQAREWAVTVFDALALLRRLAPERGKSVQTLLACERRIPRLVPRGRRLAIAGQPLALVRAGAEANH
jgi:hypothetical protein